MYDLKRKNEMFKTLFSNLTTFKRIVTEESCTS